MKYKNKTNRKTNCNIEYFDDFECNRDYFLKKLIKTDTDKTTKYKQNK